MLHHKLCLIAFQEGPRRPARIIRDENERAAPEPFNLEPLGRLRSSGDNHHPRRITVRRRRFDHLARHQPGRLTHALGSTPGVPRGLGVGATGKASLFPLLRGVVDPRRIIGHAVFFLMERFGLERGGMHHQEAHVPFEAKGIGDAGHKVNPVVTEVGDGVVGHELGVRHKQGLGADVGRQGPTLAE